MAENVKGLAMRYKHDGVVYELDSGKLVHTKGEQSIDGKKVFKTVPQVEGAPVEDNDVTNKKYVQDALDAFAAPKVASFTITATNSANAAQGAAPVEINKLKIFLADGRRLDPVFMEEGDLKGSTEAKLLVLTLNKQDQSDLTPTKVAKTEIESYALKDGEFLGKLYPCAFFAAHQDMYSNSDYQDPWNQYWTKAVRFWDEENTTSGQLRIDIFDIDQMVQKLTFTSTSSGREAVFTATANDGAKEENGDVQKKENHVFDIVFPKMGEMLSKPGPVLLSTNQVVKDVKTFATPPKSANAPVADDDVVNKAYVDENFISASGFQMEKSSVTGLVKGSNKAGSYCAFSYLKWLLKDGTRLDVKLVENVPSTSATTPVLAVWHVVKDLGAQINAPEQKSKQEIQDYELQEGEFKGTLSYFKAVGRYNCYQTPVPWGGYVGSGLTGEHEPMLGFTIDNLVSPLKALQLTVGNKGESWSYNLDTLQVTGKNGSKDYDVTYPKKAVNNEVVTVELPFSSIPDFVTVGGEQTISGVKTFAAVPKITAEPTEDTDAVNKKYIEEHFVSRPPKYDFKIEITCEGNSSYVAYSELKINLTGGKVIEPLYLEKREAKPDNNIYRFVYKISDASGVTVKQTPRKTSSEMDAYQLQDGEYIGHSYYAGYFNGECSMNAYDNQTDPWYGYLFSKGSGKLTMCQIILSGLPIDVTGIQFKAGDKHNSFSYKSTKYGAKFTYGAKAQEHELTNAQATHEFLVDAKALAPEAGNSGFVELNGDQSINGVKTFLTPPKSVKAPTDAKDIANKAYVDNRLGAGFDVTFTIKQSFSATWGGLSKLHVELAKGVLEAKYVEDVMPANAKEPALIVWTTKSTATKNPQVTYKSKEDIKGYELQDGEYLGDITYAELLGPYKSHTSADYRCPFDTYLYNGGVLGQKPLIKVNIYSLKQAVKSVRYLNGYDGHSYVGADHAVDFVVNNVESTSSLTGAGTSDDAPFVFTPTVKTLFDNEKSNYVPIKGDAIIFDKKTFTKKVFITDPDLSSEMVTGQVATRENLKAVGVIGPGIPSTQYLLVGGYMPKWEGTTTVIYQPYTLNRLKVGIEGGELFLKMTDSGTTKGDAILYQSILSRVKEFEVTGENYTKVIKTPEEVENYVLKPGEYRVWCRCTKYKYSYETNASVSANGFANLYIEDLDFEHSESGITDLKVPVSLHKSWMLHIGAARSTSTNIFAMPYFELIFFNAPKVTSFTLGIGKERNSVNNIKVYSAQGDAYSDFSKITLPANITQLEALLNKGTNGYFEDRQGNNGIGNIEHTGKDYIKSFSVELDDSVSQPNETPNKYPATETYLQAVTTINDQDIAGNKTFIKPITCTEPPVETGHLVNKKYVDDELAKLVARIAALEAAKP